ncbi:hypothetical protein [Merdimonas faecis]|uniref:hypothetical protein n=1 Tax=Merdimonas faecis TaxID=1653435 RepID=UPI0022E4C4F0|nr:hypothetical protein [Merdimonas faecis]
MESINNFDILICGEPTNDMHEFKTVLDNLSAKICKMTELIMNYNGNFGNANIEIPFWGRNVLEASLTCLLGRVDPFRLITVFKVQSDSSYDLGKKAQSAVEWSSDILAKNRDRNLWSFENKKESFDRALLGNYVGEIIWKPGFRALSDYVGNRNIDSEWLNDILAESEDANFEKGKSMASRMFSSFSKGIHSECLVDVHTILDLVTLRSLIADTYKLCATLGLVSHFIGFMAPIIEKERALNIFLSVEEMVGNVQF